MAENMSIKEAIDTMGHEATDKVTGFSGVVETVSFDLYGCIQVVVKPKAKDGEIKNGSWFDIQRLDIKFRDGRVMPLPDFKYEKGPADKPDR